MYTIVIAERKVLKLFEKYRFLLAQLLDHEDVAFCEWNKKAESIDSMTQSLLKLVGKRTEWRALVLTTDAQDQINPFDIVQYTDKVQYQKRCNERYLRWLREERFAAFEKALSNPLMKLSYALCGTPVSDKHLIPLEDLQNLRDGHITYGELMMDAQLSRTDAVTQAKNLELHHQKKLVNLFGEENAEKVIGLVAHKNFRGITELLNLEEISALIRLLCNNNTVFSDPLFMEQMVENTYKHELLGSIQDAFELKCEKPKDVICIALRTADVDNYVQSRKWMKHDESEYSKFSEYNLYPDLLKFILMDIHEAKHKSYDYDIIRYLSFVLLLAENAIPLGVVEKNKVYKAEIEDNTAKFMNLLSSYDDKLRRTASFLKEKQQETTQRNGILIDTEHLIQLVETPVSVPLVTDHPYTESMLMMKYDGLGFAKDCPTDEHNLVVSQYKGIRRNFLSFLKQPRQALSQASEDMRNSNAIDDESALYLNQYECENIEDSSYQAEDKIVTTKTADIYNNAKYQAEMEKAKKEIDDCVRVRMTKKTTVISGLIAMGAFFIGFIPLLLSSTNTLKSWLFSLVVAVSATGALFSVGVWSLWRMRRKLRKLFVKFNNTMRKMMNEVKFAMNSFSLYLTNICSFMRAQSVLNIRRENEKKEIITAKIYQKHINDIESIRSEMRDAFGKIEYEINENADDEEIYEFDFTLPMDYIYEIPIAERNDYYMDYIQEGNQITAPIYYISRILLRREELYD